MEFLSKKKKIFFISKNGYNIGLEVRCQYFTPPPPPVPHTNLFFDVYVRYGSFAGEIKLNHKNKSTMIDLFIWLNCLKYKY